MPRTTIARSAPTAFVGKSPVIGTRLESRRSQPAVVLRRLSVTCLLLAALSTGCGGRRNDETAEDNIFDPNDPSTKSDDEGSDEGDSELPNDSSGDNEATESDLSEEDASLPKFDLDVPDMIKNDGEDGMACNVDLLFVIDNSASMADYQTALGLAFPAFAKSLRSTLSSDTNVHVGVTSTEMGYSSSGNSMQSGNGCTFKGDNDVDYTEFYITPDQDMTGRNGAQGRLFRPDGLDAYFSIDMDASDQEFEKLEAWFRAAAAIGTGGSNIEMLTAPVGWVADPANAATNDGFLRDHDTVLVTFFMQDEPDQTPTMIDGKDGGKAMLERLVSAKAGCGGLDCIVAGGFTDIDVCGGTRPIAQYVDGLTRPVSIAPLPGAGSPQDIADEMNQLLTAALLSVIAETCTSIIDPK